MKKSSATRAPKKKFIPPTDAIAAVVVRRNHQWYAEFQLSGASKTEPVSKLDAWNFDIEHGLPILIVLREGEVRIIRKRNNKKYVQVEELIAPPKARLK